MKLGERLLNSEVANQDEVNKALQIQQKTGGKLGDILLAVSHIRSLDYYKILAQHYGMPFVDLLTYDVDTSLLIEDDHDLYMAKETLPIQKEQGILTVATANPSLETIDFIKSYWGDKVKIVCTTKFDILSILQKTFQDEFLFEAINTLVNTNAAFSAKTTFTKWQLVFIGACFGLSTLLFLKNKYLFFILLNAFLGVSVAGILMYKIALSIIGLLLGQKHEKPDLSSLPTKDLPIYTILIPVCREKEITLQHLFNSLQKLNYPKDKLDIKFLLEQDDHETIAILKSLSLPMTYEFIYVPFGHPKTKAKACNYGLKFARGEYLTLYDAEDKPSPYQLKIALYTFLKYKDQNVACVQSRLNFYNSKENWLTRMFTMEYTYWFNLLLPALDYLRMPIPLGGTSNHFKTSVLREIDAWDPYNVAEDADLGIRLDRLGYTTKVIASTTYEEANCQVINWIKQRTRWIKGYMQTYIVHMRNPIKLWKAVGLRGFMGFQLFVGGTILTNLVYCYLWLSFLAFLFLPYQNDLLSSSVMQLQLFNFYMGSFGMIILNILGMIRQKKYSYLTYAITAPFYWLLMSLASYRALYQLIFKPSYWDKTEHGISKILK